MPTFVWEGRTRAGDMRKGSIEADSETAALSRLRADQIQVTKVKQQGAGLNISFGTGVTEKELVVFTRQFATMIDAGLPLVQCLDILSQQAENKAFQKVLLDVKGHVEQGGTFSDGLKRHPKVFSDLYANLIAAGEAGGILDTILQRLGAYIEKAAKLKAQVKGAMTYPISVLVIAIVVVVVLLTKVIPVFQNMFKEFKSGALPKPTQVVIDMSESFQRNWYIYFAVVVALAIGLSTMLKTEKGADAFDAFLLKIPMIGNILRKVAVARFTRTLGTLLSSGVPILDALDITARTAGNRVIKRGILFAREKISEGKDMAGPLMETKIFPPMVVQMIGIGEQTGAMDTMLQKIADFYEEEVDVAVKGLTDMIEPFMMVFLGAIVGGLIIAMYMPIFELAGNIKS